MRKEPVTFMNQVYISLKNEKIEEKEALRLAIIFVTALGKKRDQTDITLYLGGDPNMSNIH